MKPQTKTILLFLIYLAFIFCFCYWYKEGIVRPDQSKIWIDLGPIIRFIVCSAVLNAVFFFAIKLTLKFSIDQFSYLTTRTIALGLIFYILSGLIIPFSFDEYYVFTAGMGLMTLFVLVKAKLVFTRANKSMDMTKSP
jgi:hypothetical protein